MSFTKTDPQNHESENIWFTPKHFIDALGPFDLDPCSVSYAPFKTANKIIYHDLGLDGLNENWIGDVWLNPPYGKHIGPFIKKFMSHRLGCMLIFSRMDNKFIHDLLKDDAYLYCLRKRIKFIDKNLNTKSNAGTGSCLVFFDEKYIKKVKKFNGVLIKRV